MQWTKQTCASHFAAVQWANSARSTVAFLILKVELCSTLREKCKEKVMGFEVSLSLEQNLLQAAKEINWKALVVAKELASFQFLCKIDCKIYAGEIKSYPDKNTPYEFRRDSATHLDLQRFTKIVWSQLPVRRLERVDVVPQAHLRVAQNRLWSLIEN